LPGGSRSTKKKREAREGLKQEHSYNNSSSEQHTTCLLPPALIHFDFSAAVPIHPARGPSGCKQNANKLLDVCLIPADTQSQTEKCAFLFL
jgi:hypothetical protein